MPAQPVAESVDAGWTVVEEHFDPARQRAQETVFSIGNGRFATRGSLEEGNRSNRPATLVHGIYAPHHSRTASLPTYPTGRRSTFTSTANVSASTQAR